MSTRRPLSQSTLRPMRWLLALPLVTVFACSDGPSPAAPKEGLSPSGPAQTDIYPGTTNTEFFGVQVGGEALGIAIKFDYSGIVTPAFTVGTKPDVLSSQVISTPAKKQAPGYWTAHAGGLKANTQYYYRLDNLKSTYWGSVKTLQRNIKFDLDSIYVEYDGDPGVGCGEWNTAVKLNREISPGVWSTWGQGIGPSVACSGTTYRYNNAEGLSLFEKASGVVGLSFDVRETDNCFPYAEICHEFNYTVGETFDVHAGGTFKVDQSLVRSYGPRARFFGKITVQFVPW